ncbi:MULTISPECIES: cell wall hydrolase [Bacillaceae]|uniref:cell wall hydrolase n=1 Tax=Bacillaceae TaxID=186817 RepID=UPI001BDEB51F|nr:MULTISPECIES: cell wall hydrolase [Bacillaceae]MDX8361018.1 cell wall hydrolase [Cytobacillus sp. IB215316]MDX8363641.1 cell wall hydrolase [Cytobacillus sp. IB215665]
MAVIPYTEKDVDLLARLIRAEAEGDGKLGMLMAGNTSVNRVRASCLDFRDITSIQKMVFQRPGGFEATIKGYFYQRARESDKQLARRLINGERFHPATNTLWFFRPEGDCPAQWFNQWNTGRFKSHCFFAPTQSECPKVY